MPSAQPRVLLAEPRGACAGVHRAIETVERALEIHGAPVYVRKQIVHNEHVVRELEGRGARFVDTEEEVPTGAVCVFSAHGVSPRVRDNARRRELTVIDATCPLVAKVHQEAIRFARDKDTLILIGHVGHEEIEGTYGEAPERTVVVGSVEEARRLDLPPDARAAYLTQTTLSVDDTAEIVAVLRERFPALTGPASADICYASQNRQNAVKAIARRSDLVLVVGSANSSNSLRLVEVARAAGAAARLLPDPELLDAAWLAGVRTVGLTAGASVPEAQVRRVLELLAELGFGEVDTEVTATENVVFRLPPELEEQAMATGGAPAAGADAAVARAAAEEKLLDRVNRRIGELLSAEEARWSAVDPRVAVPVAAVAELVAAGGKRLRPLFCLTGYLAAEGTADDDAVVDAAAALELLHAFALIHDDIMDNSPTRRGAPTVHAAHTELHARQGWAGESRRYGEGVALLAGDLALSYANRLAGRLTGPAAKVWHELVSEMIIGQQLDIALAAEMRPDRDLARWVAVCKSGRYTIHRPLALGAAIAGRPGLNGAFEAYGVAAGEAFQLRDDLLDAFGDAALTGKPTGLDLDEHKMTLLIALAADRDPRVAAQVRTGRGSAWDADGLRAALLDSGVREEVEERIKTLVADARAAVADAGLPDHWRLRFGELADMVAYRDR
ncbi:MULTISPECIES: 4-hydroxy-3-methylbut-2-enyl diphosphate reductase [unclassified Streptomyces]|uniref:4-hydroxy-3-methylbut-2-enyl diphosphate reductase n=1 Tax=unclassified Streptomyces TaxID=2593676 RepID=UPI00158722EF|nr:MULTISPECIES: 4-hydroxy-3-methylbut-2-enyl diphosphate reductase [unclassified Streptomyces]NUV66405.1 4-hydroxy-3-methylbut-2-enyl diphosphate reductase [Streptomyces sp. CAI-121]NUV98636.1 4-hydroxy-3-methylbut-2-enyl diphosphate reductase [Streptomyces sp. CAI 127]NUW11913.1 4-hydroxy-3-methylbut-2-enyl diphosphate reductase [Streptomyces sp. CAI-68]